MLDRVQHVTAIEQVKIIKKVIVENCSDGERLLEFNSDTLIQENALNYLATRSTQYTLPNNSNIKDVFDANLFIASEHRSVTDISNMESSLKRFVEAVQNVGELFSQTRINFYLNEYNNALLSKAESLIKAFSLSDKNFDGLPRELYQGLCYSLNFDSTVILTKLHGYLAINPTLTMLVVSPIFLVYFKPEVYRQFLGYGFLYNPLCFEKFISELFQVTTAMRSGLFPLASLYTANDFFTTGAFVHRHESIHIIGNSYYKYNYLTLRKGGFSELVTKTSKLNDLFIQSFKTYNIRSKSF